MNLEMFPGMLEGLLYLGLLSLVAGFLINRFKTRYTREVFLLFWLISILCFGVLSMALISFPAFFTDTFPILTYQEGLPPGFSAAFALLLIIWIILVMGVLHIYLKWDGKKSRLQHLIEAGEKREDIGETLKALFLRDEILKPYSFEFEEEKITELTPVPIEKTKAWHIHAAELLMLLSPQYHIRIGQTNGEEVTDWYPDQKCFISSYGKKQDALGILCCTEEPTLKELKRFAEFVGKHSKNEANLQLIIAVENADEEAQTVNIAGLMTFRYKEEMLRALAMYFEKYKQHLFFNFESKRLEVNSETAIGNIYVEPSGKRFERKKREPFSSLQHPVESLETYILNWLEHENVENKKQLALLGEYGQGKSVMALRLAYLIFKGHTISRRIPVIFELRGASPRSFRSQLEFLSVWAANFDIPPKVVLKFHELGRLFLIFEGFDEMDLVGNYETRLQHFQKLWSFSTTNSKMLITGRPNFFLNDRELAALLRTHKDVPALPYCEEIHLEMFSLEQTQKALRHKPPKVSSEIMSLLRSSPEQSGFRDLMKRPTLLFIASLIWEEEGLSSRGENINSVYVIDRFLEYSYRRQADKLRDDKTKAAFPTAKPILEVSERAYFMMGIAVAMAKHKGYTNQIEQVDINETITKLINRFDNEISNAGSQFYATSFQERIKNKNAKKAILRDVIACGILVRDFSGEDLFKFAHKSFLEYLVSRFYVSLLINKKAADKHKIISETISKALNIDLLSVNHTEDTAKFVGELLANETNIKHSEGYAANAKKLFRFLYPVKGLDRLPSIAFPSVKSFFWGALSGTVFSLFAAVLATVLHPWVGLALESILVIALLLFGLRIWFRIGLMSSPIWG